MICIPMAGKSSRFYLAGYSKPKFQLEIGHRSLFQLSVLSFQEFFDSETFLFILNAEHNSRDFVERELRSLEIRNYILAQTNGDTLGQADTVALALIHDAIEKKEHLLIFNIDTIRPKFKFPVHFPDFPWIETFIAEGEHWSFVVPSLNSDEVTQVVEKKRISNYCSTGIYFFSSVEEYLEVFNKYKKTTLESELYVAPLYQILINENRTVKYSLIANNEIFLAGTPSEFNSINKNALFSALGL